MNHSADSLHCSDYACQTANPEDGRFCLNCGKALQANYLWLPNGPLPGVNLGDRVGGRYLLKTPQVFLDTQPALPVTSPTTVPTEIMPYLKLFTYRLHIPQVYGVIPLVQEGKVVEIPLLEQGPLSRPQSQADRDWLLPDLATAWPGASAFRQLSWLWQIAQLWPPLEREGVVSSLLLDGKLLRVEGGIVRLLELHLDGGQPLPTLDQLGHLWRPWIATAKPEISPMLEKLGERLRQNQILTPEQLTGELEQCLKVCGQAQGRQLQVATITDQGPTRQRNEDACYPGSGESLAVSAPSYPRALAIVCDGIGGHEGGNVASNLAISTIQKQLKVLTPKTKTCDPQQLIAHLCSAIRGANDVINQRNDREHRQDRQRMGTTIVMALVQAHELYIAHVGDSRAYWITRTSCRQVTLDDDIASREVRLGYAVYREAVQGYAAGTLIQALGTNSSTMLHPNVQRLMLDGDGVLLLCSDGLSDHDRIEACWQAEILPILEAGVDPAIVCHRLVEIANTQNGHDNVTVALIHCRSVPEQNGQTVLQLSSTQIQSKTVLPPLESGQDTAGRSQPEPRPSRLKTQFFPVPTQQRTVMLWLGGCLAFSGLAVLSAYIGLPNVRTWVNIKLGWEAKPSPSTPDLPLTSPPSSPSVTPEVSTPVPVPSSPSPASVDLTSPPVLPSNAALTIGSIVVVVPSSRAVFVWSQPPAPGDAKSPQVSPQASPRKILQAGMVLKIVQKQTSSLQGSWVELRICTVLKPSEAGALKPGAIGWVSESALLSVTNVLPAPPTPVGQCR